MASTSEEERLKAEIAKLSGAIQTHKEHQHQQPHRPPYNASFAPRGRGYYSGAGTSSYRGAYNGARGGYHASASAPAGRGRGRGTTIIPPRNRTLVLNDLKAKAVSDAASGSATSGDAAGDASKTDGTNTSTSAPTDGWVKRKTTHNMSLVSASTFQRTEPARLAALEATRKAKAEAKITSSSSTHGKKAAHGKPTKPSSSVRRGDNMGEVVIDGVVFEFDPSGTKLVKKAQQPSSSSDIAHGNTPSTSTTSNPSSSAVVPLKTSINGQDYIRTKRGNLISADLLAKRRAQREAQAKMGRLDRMVGQISAIQATRNSSSRTKPSRTLDAKKARTLCTFFNKTGQCKRGLSCPYLHDSSKIALCPKVLHPSGCTLLKGTCPLSHTPRAERVPHCVHYLRAGKCRNGKQCFYTHSDKLKDGTGTKICRNFSDYGWCERGKDCEERHTYECPDFVEKGKCERKGCKLVHVIRASASREETGDGKDEDRQGAGQQGNADLFMRDDAAAAEESENEQEQRAAGKRKRPLMQSELDDDQQVLPDDADAGDEEDDQDGQVNFADTGDSRKTKRRKAKAFTQQKDFISFDDEEEEEDEQDGESEEEEALDDDAENDDEQLEVGSVHSEDFELSDVEGEHEEEAHALEYDESEDEDQEEEDQGEEEATATNAHRYQDADEDDDDDLVDRDL
ncbi:hypothetical protein NDA11_006289 [Ustilago hordei]|nr:hypothetical protein NDA11_006289 [Ustilago hordei]UTT88881.1 hypothetical protein NDA17_000321 [Ustilago hordei]